jgi:hypothetical protein
MSSLWKLEYESLYAQTARHECSSTTRMEATSSGDAQTAATRPSGGTADTRCDR